MSVWWQPASGRGSSRPGLNGAVAWTIDTDLNPIRASGIGSIVAMENRYCDAVSRCRQAVGTAGDSGDPRAGQEPVGIGLSPGG